MKYINVFARFIRPFIGIQLLLLFFILVNTVISLVPPYALKVLIDESIPKKDLPQLYQIGFGLLLIYVVRSLVNYLNAYYSDVLYNQIGDHIRKTLFKNLLKKAFDYFENNSHGSIIQLINSEVSKVLSFLIGGVIGFINNLCLVIGISLMLALLREF